MCDVCVRVVGWWLARPRLALVPWARELRARAPTASGKKTRLPRRRVGRPREADAVRCGGC